MRDQYVRHSKGGKKWSEPRLRFSYPHFVFLFLLAQLCLLEPLFYGTWDSAGPVLLMDGFGLVGWVLDKFGLWPIED